MSAGPSRASCYSLQQTQSKSKLNLLDFPAPILEKILLHVAYDFNKGYFNDSNLPYNLLPISSTCTQLRKACSLLLSNTLWDSTKNFEKSQLSYSTHNQNQIIHKDENQPILTPDELKCTCWSCKAIRSRLGWYSLSLPNQTILQFSRLYTNIPEGEASYLVCRMVQAKTPIQQLHFDNIPIFTPQRAQTMGRSLRHLVPIISNTLKTIIYSPDGHLKNYITQALCSHPLPYIKQVTFLLTGTDIQDNINLCERLLIHCADSGAKITKLTVMDTERHFEQLSILCFACPYLETISLEGACNRSFQFPSVHIMKPFKLQHLRITDTRISQNEMENLATYIANNHDKFAPEVHLSHCTIPAITQVLSTQKLKFGSKLKSLELIQDVDYHMIQMFIDYCPNLINLTINCPRKGMVFNQVAILLRTLEKLKTLKIYINLNDEFESDDDDDDDLQPTTANISELVNALKQSKSRLQTLHIQDDNQWSQQDICDIIDHHSDTLLECSFIDCVADVHDVESILLHLYESYLSLKLQNLALQRQQLSGTDSEEERQIEAEKEAEYEIKKLIRSMETKFDDFNGSRILCGLQSEQSWWH